MKEENSVKSSGQALEALGLQLQESLMGLGEIERTVDELGRIRLPFEWGRLRNVAWYQNCAMPGVISVFPAPLWSQFLQEQRQQFQACHGPATFENTARAVLRAMALQRAGKGWRCSLAPGVRELADIGPGDLVYVRVLGSWWEIRTTERRAEVVAAFQQHGTSLAPSSPYLCPVATPWPMAPCRNA